MRLIILGPPGTGKGTQAHILAQTFHLQHISTGALLRDAYAKKTLLGKKAATYWTKGKLVPDTLLKQLLSKHLPSDNFILDGFPRTLAQARWLATKRRIDKVIYLSVPEKTLLSRLLKRARADDTKQTVTKRFSVYHTTTQPLLTYYQKNLIRVNGNTTKKTVFETILKKLA